MKLKKISNIYNQPPQAERVILHTVMIAALKIAEDSGESINRA